MDRTPTLLASFDVADVDDIVFPCGRYLGTDETLVLAEITAERDHGAPDADAAQIVSTPYQISGTQVLQRVAGVKEGVWYRVRGVIHTSHGRRLVGAALFQGVRL